MDEIADTNIKRELTKPLGPVSSLFMFWYYFQIILHLNKSANRQNRCVSSTSVVCDSPLASFGFYNSAMTIIDGNMTGIADNITGLCV